MKMLQNKTKPLLILLFLFSMFAGNSLSQELGQPTLNVLGVRVEGTTSADPGLILANSGLIVGKPITGDDIQKSIRRIYALNMFRTVEILIEREVPEGAFFLINVEEYPRIDDIVIEGNKKVDDQDLSDAHNLYRGQVLRPARLFRAKREIQKIYHEKGYLLVEINPIIDDTDDLNRKTVRFEIKEGKKVKIEEIDFVGNESFKDKKLRGQLKETHERAWLGIWHSGTYDRDKYLDDLDNVVAFYRNHGYRDAEIVKDTIVYSDNLKRMNIEITVKEGTQYYFGDVSFEGNTLFDENELKAQLEFRPGDLYSEENLTYTTAEKLGNLYYDRGYIYSRIEPLLTPVSAETLDVHFAIIEGNQYKVRRINILGNDKTKEKVIRREMVLYPGETFDVSMLRRSMREITILNYFGSVVPDVQQVSEDEVDLFVEIEEKPTDQANLSAGYSERDGIIGAVGFTMPNLFGNGHRFSLDWNFGRIYRQFSISFTEPWLLNTPTLAGISFFDLRRGGTYYGFDESVTGGTLHLGRRFRFPDDYFRGDWVYRIDRTLYDSFSDAFKASNPRQLQEGVARYSSSITQTITRDSRDNPEFPSQGSVNYYQVELAGSILQGDDKYVKQVVNTEWYIPVSKRLVLYSKTRGGLLHGLTDLPSDIPYIDYFFMGGSGLSFGEPLRGYEDRAVGPQTTIGDYAVGGKSFFKQTLELRVPLLFNPTIFGLAFFDAGNTWLTVEETDMTDLRRSFGLGMRLYMPFIGLIGLDYGYGYDYPDANGRRRGRWVPHFQFGRTF
ncbi:outer membrane protein assembly factor BamA [bacterium]|nr:outer membrane protein assembly factor BamA [bacterium]